MQASRNMLYCITKTLHSEQCCVVCVCEGGDYRSIPHTMATLSASSVEPPQRWRPILLWEHSNSSVSVPVQWTSPIKKGLLPAPNNLADTTDAPNIKQYGSTVYIGIAMVFVLPHIFVVVFSFKSLWWFYTTNHMKSITMSQTFLENFMAELQLKLLFPFCS